jgi:hypothetical protein
MLNSVGNLMLAGVAVGFIGVILYQNIRAILSVVRGHRIKNSFPTRQKDFLSLLRQLATALHVLKDWREIVAVVFWTILLWFSIAVPTWLVILAF